MHTYFLQNSDRSDSFLFLKDLANMQDQKPKMEYRHLGPTGIKVSVISFGNWLNSNTQEARQLTINCVKKAWDLGVNFFDTAEVYGQGEAEKQMGDAIEQLNVPRHHIVLSTKLFWGASQNVPNQRGLSRKHIIEGAKNSLKRLRQEYVDIIFCHRPDPVVPMEEVCRAFDWLIRKGMTFYWGTSEWRAEDIAEAHYVCEKYNLPKPIAEQPQYNLYNRNKIEMQFKPFLEGKLLGTTIWSPLLGGLLTGKYNKQFPDKNRYEKHPIMAKQYQKYFVERKEQTLQALNTLAEIAKQIDCSMAQLAMAWCIRNPDISTAITGASSPAQLEETIKAVEIMKKITNEIDSRIEKAFSTTPEGKMNFLKGKKSKSRRLEILNYE